MRTCERARTHVRERLRMRMHTRMGVRMLVRIRTHVRACASACVREQFVLRSAALAETLQLVFWPPLFLVFCVAWLLVLPMGAYYACESLILCMMHGTRDGAHLVVLRLLVKLWLCYVGPPCYKSCYMSCSF